MGKFFDKDKVPYFSPSEGLEYELITSNTSGIRTRVESNPVALDPNIYYKFGTVTKKIVICKLNSFSKSYVETYVGEFYIESGGSVTFPTSIKWVGGKPDFSEEGSTYQFFIINGIGRYYKV